MQQLTDRLGELVRAVGADGSSALVALHGGHVVSWQTADGTERLFLSSKATAHNGAAIRGGIPVCFPQFAGLGSLPKHGFARTSTWRHEGGGQFALNVAPTAWPGWPHACRLELAVGLGPSTLTATLTVHNNGSEPFTFTGALHTYLACSDITSTHVHGLDGCAIHGGGQVAGDIRFADGTNDVDHSVLEPRGPVTVGELLCAQTGFADVVVWNVGKTLAAKMADLGPEEWRSYVCVEAATIGAPVTVLACGRWQGSQTLVVVTD